MTHRPTVLEALVRGKVAALDDKEDHLTSLVLGVLAWLPPSLGIAPLLRLAVDVERENLGWGRDVESFSVDLWPWWDLHAEIAGAEPDAVVEVVEAGARHLYVVESKWRSGKSGTGDHDQLMRQHANGLAEAAMRHGVLRGVLYVTTDLAFPADDLAASHAAVRAQVGLASAVFGWVSWRDAVEILERAAAVVAATQPVLGRLAADAAAYMRRNGLGRYRGLGAPRRAPGYPFRTTGLTVPRVVPPLSWS